MDSAPIFHQVRQLGLLPSISLPQKISHFGDAVDDGCMFLLQVSTIMDSWTPWLRCPGWHNIRYFLSPGHAYHFLENLQYVQRVASHQVRACPRVARPLSRPPTFILGSLISLLGVCLGMLHIPNRATFIFSAFLHLKFGSIL